MTTATLDRTTHAAAPTGRLSLTHLVRSEWIKLRTLRSTVWCYGLIVLLTIGFAVLMAFTFSTQGTPSADTQNSILVRSATLGINFTQLIVAVLGALVVTGEYSTGMIRSTLTAAPGRVGAYLSKAIVLAVTTFVVGLVGVVAAALVAAPILSTKDVQPDLFQWSVMLPMIGAAGYLTLVALFAFTFGTILRNSAGAIATVLGLLLVVPTILQILSGLTQAKWIQNVAAFLPSSAGSKFSTYQSSVTESATASGSQSSGIVDLTSWEGLAVTIGWVLVFGVIGAVLLKRRDA
ncbi:MAG TPA: ABC transporter permease subunit [Microbacteriaceae bacterium]|nr:ABC transporter permease subunit [Microbacteriaceae bacterium]